MKKKDWCGLLVSGGGSAGSTVDSGGTASWKTTWWNKIVHLMSVERQKSGVEGAKIKHSLPGHTPHPVTYLLRLDPS